MNVQPREYSRSSTPLKHPKEAPNTPHFCTSPLQTQPRHMLSAQKNNEGNVFMEIHHHVPLVGPIYLPDALIIIIYCYIGKLHVILISFNISPELRNQSMLSLLISPIYLIFNTDTQQLRGWNPLKRNDSTSVAPVVAWDLHLLVECSLINTLRQRQNGRLFQDGILKWIFLNQSERIAIKISLKFLPRVPINSIPALVQIMAWRQAIIWTNDG